MALTSRKFDEYQHLVQREFASAQDIISELESRNANLRDLYKAERLRALQLEIALNALLDEREQRIAS